tara:strand:- start:3023 stop:3706 length:684 start_codon:yes stop_codon:yes gene_type:complete
METAMTPATILRQIYATYDAGYKRRNALFALHRKIIQSPRVTRMLFGIDVDRTFVKNGFFDLTTLLLKWELQARLRAFNDPKLLEIGVGRFAVLSGWLSQHVKQRIVACDFDPIAYESAKVHVHRNDLDIEVLQSDVLSAVPAGRYDLVYWNLPYYDDPEPLLSRLFEAAPGYLSDRGTMTLGFNGKPLPVSTVIDILGRYPELEVESVRSYWWNLHALVSIKRASV